MSFDRQTIQTQLDELCSSFRDSNVEIHQFAPEHGPMQFDEIGYTMNSSFVTKVVMRLQFGQNRPDVECVSAVAALHLPIEYPDQKAIVCLYDTQGLEEKKWTDLQDTLNKHMEECKLDEMTLRGFFDFAISRLTQQCVPTGLCKLCHHSCEDGEQFVKLHCAGDWMHAYCLCAHNSEDGFGIQCESCKQQLEQSMQQLTVKDICKLRWMQEKESKIADTCESSYELPGESTCETTSESVEREQESMPAEADDKKPELTDQSDTECCVNEQSQEEVSQPCDSTIQEKSGDLDSKPTDLVQPEENPPVQSVADLFMQKPTETIVCSETAVDEPLEKPQEDMVAEKKEEELIVFDECVVVTQEAETSKPEDSTVDQQCDTDAATQIVAETTTQKTVVVEAVSPDPEKTKSKRRRNRRKQSKSKSKNGSPNTSTTTGSGESDKENPKNSPASKANEAKQSNQADRRGNQRRTNGYDATYGKTFYNGYAYQNSFHPFGNRFNYQPRFNYYQDNFANQYGASPFSHRRGRNYHQSNPMNYNNGFYDTDRLLNGPRDRVGYFAARIVRPEEEEPATVADKSATDQQTAPKVDSTTGNEATQQQQPSELDVFAENYRSAQNSQSRRYHHRQQNGGNFYPYTGNGYQPRPHLNAGFVGNGGMMGHWNGGHKNNYYSRHPFNNGYMGPGRQNLNGYLGGGQQQGPPQQHRFDGPDRRSRPAISYYGYNHHANATPFNYHSNHSESHGDSNRTEQSTMHRPPYRSRSRNQQFKKPDNNAGHEISISDLLKKETQSNMITSSVDLPVVRIVSAQARAQSNQFIGQLQQPFAQLLNLS